MDHALLYCEAKRVREAIEQVPLADRPITFSSFPRGSCGDACLVLGTYLQDDCGFPEFDYVCGERGSHADNSWTSHAWLQRGALIVDVTADQFPDAPRAIIVEENPTWHQQFETEVLHPANLRVFNGNGVHELLRLYARISRTLKRQRSDA